MLKILSKYAHVALALALILPLASGPVDARPASSSSFKSGSSSAKSSGSFGSFSRKAAGKASNDSSMPKKSRGGFGSFGSSGSADARKPDSALSRKLDKERADANALRTLDERRAAQAAREARDTAAPASGYEQRDARRPPQGSDYGYGNTAPPAQPPVIVNNTGGSGLGHIVAGAILARQAANAHANGNHDNNGYYPAPDGSAGDLANQAGANSVGGSTGGAAAQAAGGSVLGSLARTFIWLCVLSLIGWCVYFAWKRAKARREANKPNYSFERN